MSEDREILDLSGAVLTDLFDGEVHRQRWYKNLLTDQIKDGILSWFIAHIDAATLESPEYIGVATGSVLKTGLTGTDFNNKDILVNDAGYKGQRVSLNSTRSIEAIFVGLYRTDDTTVSPNAVSGNITCKIYDVSSGALPIAPIAEADSVLAAGVTADSTDPDFIKFEFPSSVQLTANTDYIIVFGGNALYNGSATRKVSVAGRGANMAGAVSVDPTTRATVQLTGDLSLWLVGAISTTMTELDDEVTRGEIVFGSRTGSNRARVSTTFGRDAAIGTFGQIGLFDSETGIGLIAVRSVDITKTTSESLTIAWELRVG